MQSQYKIVFRGGIPIQSIAFLPLDEKIVICDKEREMYIIEIAIGKIIGKGNQADLVRSSTLGYYSSSAQDFKSWSALPAPSNYWFFKSDSIRIYHPKGKYLGKKDYKMGSLKWMLYCCPTWENTLLNASLSMGKEV